MQASKLKETLAQVFSCKFCEVFKNILFYKTSVAASGTVFPRPAIHPTAEKSFQIQFKNIGLPLCYNLPVLTLAYPHDSFTFHEHKHNQCFD